MVRIIHSKRLVPDDGRGHTIGSLEFRMAIDTRQRDKSGEISRKHGNTFIRALRKIPMAKALRRAVATMRS